MLSCLIVDDSRVVRTLARGMLVPMGFSIQEAENGAVALDCCRHSMPDCILLDWHMPVMDGLECIRQLRALSGGKAPKVIFCTTETDINNIRTALEAGADEYVMKPYDADILRDKLSQVGLL